MLVTFICHENEKSQDKSVIERGNKTSRPVPDPDSEILTRMTASLPNSPKSQPSQSRELA